MSRQAGFGLVDLMMTVSVMAILGLGVASGVVAGHGATNTISEQSRVESRAFEYQQRLVAIPFGSPTDAPATAGELSELLDEDDVFGSATLHKLRAFGPVDFTLDGFAGGTWRVVVNHDLDGDGAVEAAEDEGRNDLLRIAVFFNDKLIVREVRFDPVGTP